MISGTTQVTSPIAPSSTTDIYPTHDAGYGLDGLRNVNTLAERNAIPNLRRRAGMIVGVLADDSYWRLKNVVWNGTNTDWEAFTTGGGGGSSQVGINEIAFGDSIDGTITSDSLFVRDPATGRIGIGTVSTLGYAEKLGVVGGILMKATTGSSVDLTSIDDTNTLNYQLRGYATRLELRADRYLFMKKDSTQVMDINAYGANEVSFKGSVGIGGNFNPNLGLDIRNGNIQVIAADDLFTTTPFFFTNQSQNFGMRSRADGIIGINSGMDFDVALQIGNTSNKTFPLRMRNFATDIIMVVNDLGNLGLGGGFNPTNILDIRQTASSAFVNIDFTGTDSGMLINSTNNTTVAIREGGVNQYIIKTAGGGTYIDTKGDYLLRSVSGNPLHAIQSVTGTPDHILYGNVYFQYAAVNHGIFNSSGYFGVGTISPTASIHGQGIDNTSGNYTLKLTNLALLPLIFAKNDGNVSFGDNSATFNQYLDFKGVSFFKLNYNTTSNLIYNGSELFLNGVNGNGASSFQFTSIAARTQNLIRGSAGQRLAFASVGTADMQLSTAGDLYIGADDADGVDASARLHVKGSTDDGTSVALLVEDSLGNLMMKTSTNGYTTFDRYVRIGFRGDYGQLDVYGYTANSSIIADFKNKNEQTIFNFRQESLNPYLRFYRNGVADAVIGFDGSSGGKSYFKDLLGLGYDATTVASITSRLHLKTLTDNNTTFAIRTVSTTNVDVWNLRSDGMIGHNATAQDGIQYFMVSGGGNYYGYFSTGPYSVSNFAAVGGTHRTHYYTVNGGQSNIEVDNSNSIAYNRNGILINNIGVNTSDNIGINISVLNSASVNDAIRINNGNHVMLNGKMGIGTFTPDYSVTVKTTADGDGISLKVGSTTTGRLFNYTGFGSVLYLYDDTGVLQTSMSGAGNQCFVKDQNFGIGNVSPNYRFHLINNTANTNVARIADSTQQWGLIITEPTVGTMAASIYVRDQELLLYGSGSSRRIKFQTQVFPTTLQTQDSASGWALTSAPSGSSGEVGFQHFNSATISSNGGFCSTHDMLVGSEGAFSGTIYGLTVKKYAWNNPSATFVPAVFMDGNVGIGILIPTASTHIKGTDSTSGNYSLKVDNTTGNMFSIKNDGYTNNTLGNITLGSYVGIPTISAIFMNVTPSANNYTIARTAADISYINGDQVNIAINGTIKHNTNATYSQYFQPVAVGTMAPTGPQAFVVTGQSFFKGSGNTNSTFVIRAQNTDANQLFNLTDNGQYEFLTRLDGGGSGVPNYYFKTNAGSLRFELEADPGNGSNIRFQEATVLKGFIACVSGISQFAGSYRVSLKDLNTNKTRLWVDIIGDAYVGVGDDYFTPDAMFHTNGTTNTSGALSFKFGSLSNVNILKGRNDGYVIQRAINAAITDGSLSASEMSTYIDETGNNLIIKVKYSDGTTVKTATIPLV